MADIAFLLLVFFLVTTTFNKDVVQTEKLPKKSEIDPPPVVLKPWNILDIVANKDNVVLVEGGTPEQALIYDEEEIYQIKDYVMDFFVHEKKFSNVKYPEVYYFTSQMLQDSVNYYQNALTNAENDENIHQNYVAVYKGKVKAYEKKLAATEAFTGEGTTGNVKEIPFISEKAVMALQMDRTTKFKIYIQILDAKQAALNELQDQLLQEAYNRPLSSLNLSKDEDKELKKHLDEIFKLKMMKKKSTVAAE